MNTVLYFSATGAVYETRAFGKADVDRLVQAQELVSLTSADRQFDFWFSPSTQKCQRRINQGATEMLLATTTFTPKTVPLLHGAVVIATHDADGDLDGLSWEQQELLLKERRAMSSRRERALERRIARIARDAQRAAPKIAEPALVSCARPRTAVHL